MRGRRARTRAATSGARAGSAVAVRFAGFGGQGIGLMGLLTGRAAVQHDGKHAVLTQSYGPEARGGASSTAVIIADKPVNFPLVTHPDVLVVMFQEAYTRFAGDLKPGGTLILEEDLVTPDRPPEATRRIPATRIAEGLGNKIAANIVMLGCFAAVTGLVSRRSLEEAIRAGMKPAIVDLNLKALGEGFAHAGRGVRAVTA